MKAVSSNAGLGESTRQSKGLRDVWLAAVKRRIEAGDLRNMRSGVKDRADWGQVMGLMQRRQRLQLCQRLQRVTIQANWGVESHSAMDDPVSDPRDRGARDQACRRGEYFPRSRFMIEAVSWPGPLDNCAALRVLDVEVWADADALDLTAEKQVHLA